MPFGDFLFHYELAFISLLSGYHLSLRRICDLNALVMLLLTLGNLVQELNIVLKSICNVVMADDVAIFAHGYNKPGDAEDETDVVGL